MQTARTKGKYGGESITSIKSEWAGEMMGNADHACQILSVTFA